MKSRLSTAVFIALCLGLSACAGAGSRLSRSQASRGRAVLNTAKSQIGARYRYGGSSPKKGFDCSGLAWWSHKRHDISIPRTTKKQARSGAKVPNSKIAPGDLLFFKTGRRGPSHVGIYTGRKSFIHAPKTGKRVRETKLDNPYWLKRYLGARRYY